MRAQNTAERATTSNRERDPLINGRTLRGGHGRSTGPSTGAWPVEPVRLPANGGALCRPFLDDGPYQGGPSDESPDKLLDSLIKRYVEKGESYDLPVQQGGSGHKQQPADYCAENGLLSVAHEGLLVVVEPREIARPLRLWLVGVSGTKLVTLS